jgi:hypothetical protein
VLLPLEPGGRSCVTRWAATSRTTGLGLDPARRSSWRRADAPDPLRGVGALRPAGGGGREINITGALNVLAFAQRCTSLQRIVDVSTAYVTPHPGDGVPIHEALVDLPFDVEEAYASILAGTANEQSLLATSRHANTYTLTKCLAELLLARRRGDVPLTLLRPSIVSACRRYPFPGWIDSRAAYAAFISLLGAGYLRVVRFDPERGAGPGAVRRRRPTGSWRAPSIPGSSSRCWCATRCRARQQWPAAPTWRRTMSCISRPTPTSGRRAGYFGRSPLLFRVNEWLHHHVPCGLARLSARMRRRRARTRQDRQAPRGHRLAGPGVQLLRSPHVRLPHLVPAAGGVRAGRRTWTPSPRGSRTTC